MAVVPPEFSESVLSVKHSYMIDFYYTIEMYIVQWLTNKVYIHSTSNIASQLYISHNDKCIAVHGLCQLYSMTLCYVKMI